MDFSLSQLAGLHRAGINFCLPTHSTAGREGSPACCLVSHTIRGWNRPGVWRGSRGDIAVSNNAENRAGSPGSCLIHILSSRWYYLSSNSLVLFWSTWSITSGLCDILSSASLETISIHQSSWSLVRIQKSQDIPGWRRLWLFLTNCYSYIKEIFLDQKTLSPPANEWQSKGTTIFQETQSLTRGDLGSGIWKHLGSERISLCFSSD